MSIRETDGHLVRGEVLEDESYAAWAQGLRDTNQGRVQEPEEFTEVDALEALAQVIADGGRRGPSFTLAEAVAQPQPPELTVRDQHSNGQPGGPRELPRRSRPAAPLGGRTRRSLRRPPAREAGCRRLVSTTSEDRQHRGAAWPAWTRVTADAPGRLP
jgi:hypothetical protein